MAGLSDDHWRLLTETSMRRTRRADHAALRTEDVMQFECHPNDYELWDAYDRISAPTLCFAEVVRLLLPRRRRKCEKARASRVVVTISAAASPRAQRPGQFDRCTTFSERQVLMPA